VVQIGKSNRKSSNFGTTNKIETCSKEVVSSGPEVIQLHPLRTA